MALVATIPGILSANFAIEDEDYIYLNGQACEKATLTPVFGKYTGTNGMPAALNKAPHMRKYFTGEQGTGVDTLGRDTTLTNPSNIGYTYPLFKQTQSGNYYHTMGGITSAYTGVTATNYIYGRALGTNQYYDSVYSIASTTYVSIPYILGSKTDGTTLVTLDGRQAGTTVSWLVTYPAVPGASTNIATTIGNRISQVIYEDATYWYTACIAATTATNPTSATIVAVNKSTAAGTVVYAATNQGTGYPTCNMSNAYTLSSTSVYTYCVVANATDPVYTIRYFNMNPSTPTATAGSCTINWGSTTSAAEFAASNRTATTPILRSWIVHTATADYLCFALMELSGAISEVAANMKMYVFTINPSTPSTLTFKQTVSLGSLHGYIKNVFPIADDYTTVGVVTAGNMHLYTFNDATGYQLGAAIPHSIFTATGDVPALAGGIGVDELGRIWVQNAGNIGSTLHVYSTTLATSITLAFAQTSYDYTGSVIASSFNLSAYNSSGSRIVTDVQVVLDSNNCTFSDDTTTKTITTSSSAEVNTAVKITGPGQIRAIANIAI